VKILTRIFFLVCLFALPSLAGVLVDSKKRFALEDLVLDSITKHEAIVPDEEEIQAEVVQMAAEYKQKPEDLWKNLHENNGMKYVRHSAARKKTMRFLMDNAVLD